MTREEAMALLERYSNYDGMGIPNLAGCKEAMKVAVESLKEAFPELAESEDERIRKVLSIIVDEMPLMDTELRAHGLSKERVLAYLEKQKENPKSADSIPSDCVSDAKCEDKSPKHSDSDGTDIRDTPAYWKGWDDAMKQKEQKHPNGCFTCDEYKKGYEVGRSNGFTAGYNKAMKEVDQKEQKPAWSEEDEEMRNLIIAIFEVNHPDGFFKANELGTTDMRSVNTEEIISWLKSLRPQGSKDSLQTHWKPSEEQIYSLGTVVKGYDECTVGSVGYRLKEMYEQLKKLM